MDYEQLDDYSKEFLDKILSEVPNYMQYAEVKKYDDNSKDTYLDIVIPCPSDSKSSLCISTYGDEITVEYDYFHYHFGYNVSDEEDYDEAIKMVKEIINEEIIVITGTRQGKWAFSFFIKSEERPFMEMPYDNYDAINIKSWNGTFNEIIRI